MYPVSELGYAEFLEQLLTEELLARQENHLRRKMKVAGFPYMATIEQFDFSWRPELKRAVLMRFFDSSFITTAGSLLLIGPSGLGKTHLAVALGTKMVQLGYTVRFVVAQRFANAVVTATTRTELARLLAPLISCDLLILDEFGYLNVEPQVGPVLYEIIAGRYEKGGDRDYLQQEPVELGRTGGRHGVDDGHHRPLVASWGGVLLTWRFLPHACEGASGLECEARVHVIGEAMTKQEFQQRFEAALEVAVQNAQHGLLGPPTRWTTLRDHLENEKEV